MGKHHRGQPLGQNKKEGLGIKPVMSGENLEGSEEIARKSTNDEEQLLTNVNQRYPNRDTDRKDSTNSSGYRQ